MTKLCNIIVQFGPVESLQDALDLYSSFQDKVHGGNSVLY